MPLPPRRPRKHATVDEARAASSKALEPYRWKSGESGNPRGFPGSRREQLEAIERLAREASPEMIEILQEMARHSEDDRVRTMAATKLLEFLPKVKEDSGDGSLAKFEKMSPRELREWLIGECEDISRIEVPEGFILSPEDSARHAVVQAALAKAVHGIAVLGGRLVDRDAWERDRLRDADNRLGMSRRKQRAERPIDVGSPGTSTAPSEGPRGSEGGQFEVTPSSVTRSDPVTPSAKCENCGTMFAPKRSTARYCSTNCRMAAHRRRGDA